MAGETELAKVLDHPPQIIDNAFPVVGERGEAPKSDLDPFLQVQLPWLKKMGWGVFRSFSLSLFRYTRHQLPPSQRFGPFTMGAAETQTVNTTKRLQALRELMSQEKYNVNALIIPSEDQRALRDQSHPDIIADLLAL